MARKESRNTDQSRGFSDIIGIVLIAAAVLLLVAQFSFDRYDIDSNRVPPNQTVNNWIGPAGAFSAYGLFFLFGAWAFVLPVILIVFALGYLFDLFAYLKHCWLWALVLFLSGLGFFDLYTHTAFLDNLCQNLNAPSAGGTSGQLLNRLFFGHFGTPGATILYVTTYIVSLLYLTNFQLGKWLQKLWRERQLLRSAANKDPKSWSPEEKALALQAAKLQKQTLKLQKQVGTSQTASPEPDLAPIPEPQREPVPEPTVHDHSVPRPSQSRASRKPAPPPEPEPEEVFNEEEVQELEESEVGAASTQDVLGRSANAVEGDDEGNSKEDEESEGEAHDAEDDGDTEDEKDESPMAPEEPARPRPLTAAEAAKLRGPRKPKAFSIAKAPLIGNYQLPDLDLLQNPDLGIVPSDSKADLVNNAKVMQQTLAQFNIEVALGDITKGPTITRYELHPAPGVKLEKIVNLNNNLTAALKAERIHILAPIPGKSAVGVEVPNKIKTKVILRDLLESEKWHKTKMRIPLALGKDVYGQPILADLADMPHLLIAGSTGSGKSVCINSIIASLLFRFPPDQLRFVMIDPKVVELQHYNALPHLVVPVVTDPKKVVLALRWVVNEMENRYKIFAKVGVRNIKSFNERQKDKKAEREREPELPLTVTKENIEAGSEGFAVELDEEMLTQEIDEIEIPDKLHYIVVVIDELADLMLVAPADVEMAIARITQMARAAGIHCIVATQRPSVDVITGVIKANIPARIAFQVASKVDSRTILDGMGADKLLGKGDMLYLPPGSARLIRAQGALITDEELNDIVDFIAKQGKPSYDLDIHQQLSKSSGNYSVEAGASDEDEDLIQQCIDVIRSEQKASVSLLQRRLRLGYTRAARIMDEIEERGIVGPSKGAEPRDILIDLDGTGADGRPVTAY